MVVGLGACVAPATGITLISGQTGYLSGALMIGGLRLLPTRPALAGVLFGLLAYKPQLGVLVPVALVAIGGWRAIAAAAATLLAGVAASSLVYGFSLWGLWLHSMVEYATRFHPVSATCRRSTPMRSCSGAWRSRRLGLAARRCRSRSGSSSGAPIATDRASARRRSLVVGTFLATPHAFNYDMPMMTLALVWYFVERYRVEGRLDVGEIVALLLAFAMPFSCWS